MERLIGKSRPLLAEQRAARSARAAVGARSGGDEAAVSEEPA